MKLGMMQPYFFPYIGYYQGIHACDRYILYDLVPFIKGGWINKNRYLTLNGSPAFFLVDVKKSSSLRIDRIELSESDRWRKKFLNGLEMNYRKCPFFEETHQLVKDVVYSDAARLSELNLQSIRAVCEHLGIKTDISLASETYTVYEEALHGEPGNFPEELREIAGGNDKTRFLRIIGICRRENAEVYINPIGGSELYSKEDFSLNGTELLFLQPGEIRYRQTTGTFVPNLSIIDTLMNAGREKTRLLLKEYTLR